MKCRTLFSALLFKFMMLTVATDKNGELQEQEPSKPNFVNPKPIPGLPVCDGENAEELFSGNSDTYPIPMLSIPDSTYLTVFFPLKISEFLCPMGTKPTRELQLVPLKRNQPQWWNTTDLLKLLENNVFLLSDGQLSVGKNFRSVQYYSPGEYCISKITQSYQGDEFLSVQVRTCPYDEKRPVFSKCCPIGMAFNERFECESWDEAMSIDYFDPSTHKMVKTSEMKPVYTWKGNFECYRRYQLETWEADGCNNEFHPLTDNRASFVGSDRRWNYIDDNEDIPKCFDHMVSNNTLKTTVFRHCREIPEEGEFKTKKLVSLIYMVSMYIAAIFYLLTVLVYLFTWKMQNIHGRIFCSCVISLLFMQLFLANSKYLGRYPTSSRTKLCVYNGIFAQYFMISSFTWLLVVNLNLWLTFRKLGTAGDERTPNFLKRFLTFSGVGWGFPFLVSLISVSLEYSFPCRTSGVSIPDFGKENCFLGEWSQGIYVYYIIAALLLITFGFMILTTLELFGTQRKYTRVSEKKKLENKQAFFLFLKLSVVMSLAWVFDIISWATKKPGDTLTAWAILDLYLYKMVSSIFVFIFFVYSGNTIIMIDNDHQTSSRNKGFSITNMLPKFGLWQEKKTVGELDDDNDDESSPMLPHGRNSKQFNLYK